MRHFVGFFAAAAISASALVACTPFQEIVDVTPDAGKSPDARAPHDTGSVVLPPRDSGHGPDARTTKDATPLPDTGSPADVGSPFEAGSHVDATVHPDAGTPEDAGHDAGHDTGMHATNDSGIDPLLSLPPADASTCSPVGNIVVCPLGNCLVANPTTTGRCQTCSHSGGDCDGHKNAPCDDAEGCDIGWACYNGACTLMCNLDAGSVFCAFPSVCTNVGNVIAGVCQP